MNAGLARIHVTVACDRGRDRRGWTPLNIVFSADATNEGCDDNIEFRWDFGDRSTSDIQNPSHVYTKPGIYTWFVRAHSERFACIKWGEITVEPGPRPGDCNDDETVSIGEVQRSINMFLDVEPAACGVDCDGSGTASIGEVQRAINGFLGEETSC